MNYFDAMRKKPLNVVIVLIAICTVSCNSFPSKSEVDATFERWEQENSGHVKSEIIVKLLDQISVTNDAHEGEIASYALDKIVDTYLKTEDESILVAVDQAPRVVGGVHE